MIRVAASALLALFVAACSAAGGFPDNPIDTGTDLAALKTYFGTKKISEYDTTTDGEKKRQLRNEIIYGRIAAYDAEFADFQQSINRERVLSSALADGSIAIMGGAGAALASKTTKTALLGATSAVTGIKGAIDKNLFYDQAMAAVFSSMSSNRDIIRARIIMSLGNSITEYPLTRGISDTIAYREAGSLPAALIAISERAGNAKVEGRRDLDSAILYSTKLDLMKSGFSIDTKGDVVRTSQRPDAERRYRVRSACANDNSKCNEKELNRLVCDKDRKDPKCDVSKL